MGAYVAKTNRLKANRTDKIEKAKVFAENEKITIIDLQNYFKDMPKLENAAGKAIKMDNVRAIILHQDMDIGEDAFTSFIPKVVAGSKPMYHFVIDKEGVIFQLKPTDEAVNHAKFNSYSRKANDYFGEQICPLYENTELSVHAEETSPNFCTISICLPKINTSGDVGNKAYNEACRLIAYIINSISPALQVQSNVLPITYIPKLDQVPSVFNGDAKKLKAFRYEAEKLRGRWLTYEYKDIVRPWPNVVYKVPVEQ